MTNDVMLETVLEKLRQKAKAAPALEALLPTYEAFLRMEEEADVPPLERSLCPTAARTMLAIGTPLLHAGETPLFPDPMAVVWQGVCDLATQQMEDPAGELAHVRAWPETEREMWLAMMDDYFRTGRIDAGEEDQGPLTFLLVHTWRPFLKRWAADVAPLIDTAIWKQKHCPACGGEPDFAYLNTESGERHLICARCDTDWRYQRTGCTFCGNQDAKTYGYYKDKEGGYRLYVCQACQRYLKTIDLRETGAGRLMVVERIATVEMDLSAIQAGFQSS